MLYVSLPTCNFLGEVADRVGGMESSQRKGKKRTKREVSCFEEKLSKKSKRIRSVVHAVDQKGLSPASTGGED